MSPLPPPPGAPVAMPVGTAVGEALAGTTAPPGMDAAPDQASWIPSYRPGRVGKSVAAVAGTAQNHVDPLAPDGRILRRTWRRRSHSNWAMVLLGGLCLICVLALLLAVALHRH